MCFKTCKLILRNALRAVAGTSALFLEPDHAQRRGARRRLGRRAMFLIDCRNRNTIDVAGPVNNRVSKKKQRKKGGYNQFSVPVNRPDGNGDRG